MLVPSLFRYVRNAEGRIVLSSLAGTEVLKRVMSADDGRDVRLPATAHPYAAPLADVAGLGRTVVDADLPDVKGGRAKSAEGEAHAAMQHTSDVERCLS
jgi:hypothetical protein